MKGGEFLRFNLGLWHNFTTLSINFQVFSMVFLLISNLKYNHVKLSCSVLILRSFSDKMVKEESPGRSDTG